MIGRTYSVGLAIRALSTDLPYVRANLNINVTAAESLTLGMIDTSHCYPFCIRFPFRTNKKLPAPRQAAAVLGGQTLSVIGQRSQRARK